MQPPGHRYFPHDRDAWPAVQGLPFEVFTERWEDQMAAEAKAASPFNFDHDDKENDVVNPETIPLDDPLDGMDVMLGCQYQLSSSEHEAVRNELFVMQALYNDETKDFFSPYGLGGSDGSQDAEDHGIQKAFMDILASGETLPPAPVADNANPVIGGPSSSKTVEDKTNDIDSVIGVSSPGNSFAAKGDDTNSVIGGPSSSKTVEGETNETDSVVRSPSASNSCGPKGGDTDYILGASSASKTTETNAADTNHLLGSPSSSKTIAGTAANTDTSTGQHVSGDAIQCEADEISSIFVLPGHEGCIEDDATV
jgi:hypothetical protein